jgi:hypothetical protein
MKYTFQTNVTQEIQLEQYSIVRLNGRPRRTGLDQKVLLACIKAGTLAIKIVRLNVTNSLRYQSAGLNVR